MRKEKSNLLKIIFSKNPNCSGYGFIYIFGIYFLIVSFLAPILVFVFEFFSERLNEEKKEKIRKYLKKGLFWVFLIYFFTLLLTYLLVKVWGYYEIASISLTFGFFSSFVLSFLFACGLMGVFIFSRKGKKRPILKLFIFEVFFVCFISVIFIFLLELIRNILAIFLS